MHAHEKEHSKPQICTNRVLILIEIQFIRIIFVHKVYEVNWNRYFLSTILYFTNWFQQCSHLESIDFTMLVTTSTLKMMA